MLSISWATESESIDLDSPDVFVLSLTEHLLEFDCVTTEAHEWTAELSEHALEDGATIADHKRINPKRITIECLVTNTPLDQPPNSGYGRESSTIVARIGSEGAQVLQFETEFDRIADVTNTLERLLNESTAVTVSTRIKTYDSCQIIGVTAPRKSEDGDSISFNITIVEFRIAVSRETSDLLPREPRGSDTPDRGSREAGEERPRRSAMAEASEAYDRRRAEGETPFEAAMGAAGDVFSPG